MDKKIIPKFIGLEASSICQLRCPSCPTASGEIKNGMGNGFLKFRDFQQLLTASSFVKEIELSNYGEILLNPEFLDIIKYAFERKIKLRADNGVNLNTAKDEILESLIKYRFHSMVCSIDGANQETYKIYRIKGNFNNVISNIKKLNFYKKKYQSKYPLLTWQFVLFGHNEHEIPLAKKMADELNMTFRLKLSWDPNFSPIKDLEFIQSEIDSKIISRKLFKEKKRIKYSQAFCHQLWEKPQINWDGRVLGCCINYWSDFGSDVFEDGLINGVNNERITYAREMLVGTKPERQDIPCSKCDNYISMKKNSIWLKRGLSRNIYIALRKAYFGFKKLYTS